MIHPRRKTCIRIMEWVACFCFFLGDDLPIGKDSDRRIGDDIDPITIGFFLLFQFALPHQIDSKVMFLHIGEEAIVPKLAVAKAAEGGDIHQ